MLRWAGRMWRTASACAERVWICRSFRDSPCAGADEKPGGELAAVVPHGQRDVAQKDAQRGDRPLVVEGGRHRLGSRSAVVAQPPPEQQAVGRARVEIRPRAVQGQRTDSPAGVVAENRALGLQGDFAGEVFLADLADQNNAIVTQQRGRGDGAFLVLRGPHHGADRQRALLRCNGGAGADRAHGLALRAARIRRHGCLQQRDRAVGPDQRILPRPGALDGGHGAVLFSARRDLPQDRPRVQIEKRDCPVAAQEVGDQQLLLVHPHLDADRRHVSRRDRRRQGQRGDEPGAGRLEQRQDCAGNQHHDGDYAGDDRHAAQGNDPAGGLVAPLDSSKRGFAERKHDGSSASPRSCQKGTVPRLCGRLIARS